ncbi:hypothetical protein E2C01_005903 [Portunus trituberculatus]|uniref:Uncharacterized protein n=1 Tax=Portunus trituberculatus TaxID=210409 RepID=A0A5B7CTW5_PORTR|nr:hypothetical protein [Portunus trituberculatus]
MRRHDQHWLPVMRSMQTRDRRRTERDAAVFLVNLICDGVKGEAFRLALGKLKGGAALALGGGKVGRLKLARDLAVFPAKVEDKVNHISVRWGRTL